ncbi:MULTISPECIES: hypothetical protein [Paenibacillus]|uniref:hypothetical protein n=1 Tax=Paenibacillus TaxID=44249 RepID=UPI000F537005|nr:hypothetical protein [Paenibacillus xylanexedens]
MPKRENYYEIGDGWGTIGYGFHCVLCGKENNFVKFYFDEHACKDCGHVTYLNPIDVEDIIDGIHG